MAAAAAVRESAFGFSPAVLMAAACCAFVVAMQLYSPAFRGGFLFDDLGLPFHKDMAHEPLRVWMSTVRPLLMFTYWVNYTLWGRSPGAYHLTNLAIHVLNVYLVFLILLRTFHRAGWTAGESRLAALVGAAVFLVHPLETESVAYIAGRSESLAALFLLAAYAVFLYRRAPGISWLESIAVIALFVMAVAAKENAVALAGLLVLTDLFWPADGWLKQLRRNWRLYCLMVPGLPAAIAVVWRVLATSGSAGFAVPGMTWYQYGFTQARAIFVYIRMFLLPVGQSVDHDFAVSHSLTEHGAVFYLAALLALGVAAYVWRRRFPLPAFGLLMFLILLAPTSSIIPIGDTLVERRMYTPLIGLILIGAALLRAWQPRRIATVALIGVFLLGDLALCYQRNQLWGDPARLWVATVEGSPHKPLAYTNLAETFIAQHRCPEALPYLERAQTLLPGDARLEESYARVLECAGRREEALTWLARAAVLDPHSWTYVWIGLLDGEMGRSEEAGRALKHAVALDFWSVSAHDALGLWYESVGQPDQARVEYRHSLNLDGDDTVAQVALIRLAPAPSAR